MKNTSRVFAKSFLPDSDRVRLVWLGLLFALFAQVVAAQAPAVHWRRSDWAPMHPVSGVQTQDQSSEDWWYDHKNSYSNNVLNGYICAGYSDFRNWAVNEPNGGCQVGAPGGPDCGSFETTGNVRGDNLATLALISPDGANRIWFKTYNSGYFYRVIQTSDGGYLAVGITGSTRKPDGTSLYYNPNQKAGQVADQFDTGTACTAGVVKWHINLVKTDAVGNVQWQYLYGMTPYRDSAGNSQPAAAYANESDGWDLIETPGGHFRVVGNAHDPGYTYYCNNQTTVLRRAFMMEVGANGYWQWGSFYGPTSYPSNGASITRYSVGGNVKYVMGGTELFQGSTFNGYTGCNLFQKAFVMQFDDTASPTAQWKRSAFDPNTSASQSNYDVRVNTNGQILFPIIVNCTGCLYAGFNSGQAKVYRLDSLGNTLGACELGQVTAFDLKLRVSPTADGGFGAVSTKQLLPPPTDFSCYGTSTWNTDAYVAKCNACDGLEWETTFNVDNNPPAPFPSDQKKQECLYSITQGDDGGFVVSGNNSYNFDDDYLVKLLPATSLTSDLYMKDTPLDVGVEPNPDPGPMWVSQDIWVRPDSSSGFSDDTHVNPTHGQSSWVFVRIRNKGCQPASGTLKVYWSKASTGLSWPQNWVNYVPMVTNCPSGVVYGDQIGPGIAINVLPNQEVRVPIHWLPPNPSDFTCAGPEPGHFCLLARLETSQGMSYAEGTDVNANVNSNNRIIWKNLTVLEGSQEKLVEPVIVRNVLNKAAITKLSFEIPEAECQESFFKYGTVDVYLGNELAQKWSRGGKIGGGVQNVDRMTLRILKPNAWIGNLLLGPKEMHTIRVRFNLLKTPILTRNVFNLDLIQSASTRNKTVGGVRFTVRTRNSLPRRLDVSSAQLAAAERAGSPTGCLATIQGVVFNDLNRDGLQDPDPEAGEVGLAGWQVTVRASDRNSLSATTDAQGNYSVDVPSPGTYTVSLTPRRGWQQTAPPGQAVRTVRTRAGQKADGVDFGNFGGAAPRQLKLEQGTRELGIWGGGSSTQSKLVGVTGDETFAFLGLRYGRVLAADRHMALAYIFDAFPVTFTSYPEVERVVLRRDPFLFREQEVRRTTYGAGLSPAGLQLYFTPAGSLRPFVSGSAGFLFFQDSFRRSKGARLNLTFDFGAGLQWQTGARHALNMGYKYQHLSSFERALNNPGFDAHIFYTGVSFFK